MPLQLAHITLATSKKFIEQDDEALIMKLTQHKSNLNIKQTPTWRTVTPHNLFLVLAHRMILDEENVSHRLIKSLDLDNK